MYATILQSKNATSGVRQTAFIPNPFGDEPFVYTRTLGNETKLRGSAGAWLEVSRTGRGHLFVDTEHDVVLGNPVSIAMTVNDERDISSHVKPTTLLQKLARAVQPQVTASASSIEEVFSEVYSTLDHEPQHLARYAKSNQFVAPALQVTIDPKPAVVAEPDVAVHSTESDSERVWANLVVPPKPALHIERVWDGISELDMFTRGIPQGETYLLSGEAGTGKTQTVENLANYLNLPLVRIEMHQSLSLADTEGRLLPTTDNGWRWHYSRLATGIKEGAVILLNELSRSLPSNATLFLGILQERQLTIETLNEVIPVHPNTIFIADQNVGQHYVATRQQDHALLERFKTKLEYDDDPNIESQLIPSPALLEVANGIRSLHRQDPAKYRTRVGLRMLINFVRHAKVYNFSFAVNRFLANFPEAERESVGDHLFAVSSNISTELGVELGSYAN